MSNNSSSFYFVAHFSHLMSPSDKKDTAKRKVLSKSEQLKSLKENAFFGWVLKEDEE